ncbi:MAG: hypothetical protein J5858_11935 [Lentisphaeria bacterium]|nr:hypothetical protein [Lentisphaeria bacterium]
MEENKNTNTAAAAEATIESIKKLLDAVGNDEELKQKLEAALAALTGKKTEAAGKDEEPVKEEATPAATEEESADEDDDEGKFTPGSDLPDIFTEDAIAGMVVGFVAGAAVVGGGVLIHKIISR